MGGEAVGGYFWGCGPSYAQESHCLGRVSPSRTGFSLPSVPQGWGVPSRFKPTPTGGPSVLERAQAWRNSAGGRLVLHEVKTRAKAAGSGSAGPTAPGATAAADTPHFPFSPKAPPFPQSPPVQAKPPLRHSPPLIFFSFVGEGSALGANHPSRAVALRNSEAKISHEDKTQRSDTETRGQAFGHVAWQPHLAESQRGRAPSEPGEPRTSLGSGPSLSSLLLITSPHHSPPSGPGGPCESRKAPWIVRLLPGLGHPLPREHSEAAHWL